MKKRRRCAVCIVSLLPLAALAACGDDDPENTAGGSEPTGGPGGAVDLARVCPATVTIQTDWYPEAEHGALYNLIGDDYVIDVDTARVKGALTVDGVDTGVDLEVRSGGPAIGQGVTVSEQLYIDEDILLGYVYTDEAIQFSTRYPTIAIESGFEKSPQMIMWDPATYPEVTTIEDVGEAGILVRYFTGVAYMAYFTESGILSPEQVEGGYDGTPDKFTTDEGRSAQQGFGSAEPYIYEHEVPNWMKPIAYAYIHDAGWENYAQSIATRPENIETSRDCFTKLAPILQQSSIDYLEDPAAANHVIIDAVETFDTFWVYSEGVADYGVATMLADGLVANGPDDVVGNFDLDRVEGMIEKATPIYEGGGEDVKDGLTAEDIVTNEFIDESIGF